MLATYSTRRIIKLLDRGPRQTPIGHAASFTLACPRSTPTVPSVIINRNVDVVKQLVALLSVSDSWYVRSRKSCCCESNLVVSPEFQGRGIGREMIDIEMAIGVELGYTTMINDYSASNQRMRLVLRRMFGRKLVIIGCIPRGVYTTGIGWDDQVICFQNVEDVRPFTEIAEHSRMRRVHLNANV